MNGRLRIPAEWEPHEACWIAFPYLADEWPDTLAEAQQAIASLCKTIAGPGAEAVRLLVRNDQVEASARRLLEGTEGIEYVRADYGDCWVRDTLPTFGWTNQSGLGGLRFRFNGWGERYQMPFDDTVGLSVLSGLGAADVFVDIVLEGGALEPNGAGTIITTESCVLNDNRNPGLTRARFEEALEAKVAVDRIVWLEDGLAHDHTDGHVDMVARFVSENRVACMAPNRDAPNAEVLENVIRRLESEGFELLELPAAPAVEARDGRPLPGTYGNFYVANQAVIVPQYGVPEDQRALDAIGSAFPSRKAIGLPTRDLLCGGGSFHCTTQPMPAAPSRA